MHPVLTQREKQILALIVGGFTNREISFRLSISESTVEKHVHKVYKKLMVSNRAQAVAYVLRSRAVLPDSEKKNGGNPS